MTDQKLTQEAAVDLLRGLVSIQSLSRAEEAACCWLVAEMTRLGYDRAYVDEAGNAVGEMGEKHASRTIVLLGHIDTVPGDIPVRIEPSDGLDESKGPVLYGRGSVDAKGPLATFVAGVASVGSAWAHEQDVRLLVVGAVEEEAATSKGARYIRDQLTGTAGPVPDACIIGEPSSWRRITLGYKGRLLVSLEASQPMAHTAGPDAGVSTVAVDFWNWIAGYCGAFNADQEKIFDRLLPSLRALHSDTDVQLNDTVTAQAGIRLPLDFDAADLVHGLAGWAIERTGAEQGDDPAILSADLDGALRFAGPTCTIELSFRGYERAWRSDRSNSLVRSFLGSVREIAPGTRPGFVVKTGTSDMNVVGPAWQCPILAYGPGDSNLDHTPNEHIHLHEYWLAVQVLEQALRNWSAADG
jgi:LysW-gamma-L-lysine carboxypeptidase